jgi:predicted RNase H-like nuclease (RuvC/YqgF family)
LQSLAQCKKVRLDSNNNNIFMDSRQDLVNLLRQQLASVRIENLQLKELSKMSKPAVLLKETVNKATITDEPEKPDDYTPNDNDTHKYEHEINSLRKTIETQTLTISHHENEISHYRSLISGCETEADNWKRKYSLVNQRVSKMIEN